MVQQPKTFRHGQTMAPYREPRKSAKFSKTSLFSKITAFLDRKTSSNSNTRDVESQHLDESNTKINQLPRIPGGFFSADNSETSLHLPKRRNLKPSDRHLVNNGDQSSSVVQEVADDSCSADISNARLADFFKEKGNQPLSAMEMEGVISLMKKANNSTISHTDSVIGSIAGHNDSIEMASSRVLKSSRAPSVASSSFKPPTFIPKYDSSLRSHSIANPSVRSVSARKRVFDYANFPSPYRTTVYKYSAADNREIESKPSSASSSSNPTSRGAVQGSTASSFSGDMKKLSNTASALVSLLDGPSTDKQSVSQLANPYSSHVLKYKKSNSGGKKRQDLPAEASIVQECESEVAKHGAVAEVLPKQLQNSIDKYKPVRSSSLRSGIEANERPIEQKQNNEEATRSPLPVSSKFTFKFRGSADEESGREQVQREKIVPSDEVTFPADHEKKNSFCPPQPHLNNVPEKIQQDVQSIDEYKTVGLIGEHRKPSQVDDKCLPAFNLGSRHEPNRKAPTNHKAAKNVLHSFNFGMPIPSSINAREVANDQKVNEFRTSFIF